MYFVELLFKKFAKKNQEIEYNPNSQAQEEEYEGCEHVFMPVDSTNEILSCAKCGVLKRIEEVKRRNFFIKE